MDPSEFQSVPRPHGTIILASDQGEVQADTLQCQHCGGHWVVMKGSGRTRGWCMDCGGPTCGSPACNHCQHYMKKIEIAER